MENRNKLILLIIIFLILDSSILSFILYQSIFYPSYLSVQSGCNIISEEELSNLGYSVVGYYRPSDNSITYLDSDKNVISESEADYKSIRHESVHKFLSEHGLSHSCKYKFFRFIEEVIAYSYQYL